MGNPLVRFVPKRESKVNVAKGLCQQALCMLSRAQTSLILISTPVGDVSGVCGVCRGARMVERHRGVCPNPTPANLRTIPAGVLASELEREGGEAAVNFRHSGRGSSPQPGIGGIREVRGQVFEGTVFCR